MIEASCHCGAVQLKISRTLDEVTDCNCTLCRSYGALWAYFSPKDVEVTNAATDIYMRDQRKIQFYRCKHCGCVTHWMAVDKARDRMGVNARLMAPEMLSQVRVRHLDGADTWKYLD